LDHDIDTGHIIMQMPFDIPDTADVEYVYDGLMHLGAEICLETLQRIVEADGHPLSVAQDQTADNSTPLKAAPKIFKDTCRIDWTRPAEALYNHIRGLSPYPAAWTVLVDEHGNEVTTIKVYKTGEPEPFADGVRPAAGSILADRKTLRVACADGWLQVFSLQQSGKKRMDTDAFLRGFTLLPTHHF
jgi:methionyl-tRNA formyltransferase